MLHLVRLVLIVVVVFTAVFHCATYLLWIYESRRGAGPSVQRRGPHLWTAWLAEWLALTSIVLAWPLGFLPGRRVRRATDARPVVLVHGWSLNRASLAWFAARLRRDGRPAYAINYPSMLAETDAKAEAVARRIGEIARDAGVERVDVVAHSLGGVVVRAAARWHGAAPLLGNVVTLGAPHRGSAFALLLRSFGVLQMRPGSRFLQRLEEGETLAETVNLTAVASDFDAIVHPLDGCYLPTALNVTIEGIGHHALLFSERVYGIAKENLDSPLKQENLDSPLKQENLDSPLKQENLDSAAKPTDLDPRPTKGDAPGDG